MTYMDRTRSEQQGGENHPAKRWRLPIRWFKDYLKFLFPLRWSRGMRAAGVLCGSLRLRGTLSRF